MKSKAFYFKTASIFLKKKSKGNYFYSLQDDDDDNKKKKTLFPIQKVKNIPSQTIRNKIPS